MGADLCLQYISSSLFWAVCVPECVVRDRQNHYPLKFRTIYLMRKMMKNLRRFEKFENFKKKTIEDQMNVEAQLAKQLGLDSMTINEDEAETTSIDGDGEDEDDPVVL